MKFLALNIDFSSLRSAQAGVKDGYPLESGYFTAIGSCSMKTVADRHRHAAYHKSNSDKLFIGVTSMTLNDL